MPKIVIITSSQPSLNPRMVKEADTLSDAGYEVIVVGQFWNQWAQEQDKKLLRKKKWKFIQVGGNPETLRHLYFLSRFRHKIFRTLRNRFGLRYGIAENSIGRCSNLLYQTARNIKASLYIGHNPGGLAPAVRAAKYHSALCGFDAEDFHRREYSDDPNHPDVLCKTFLEHKYYPKLNYITCASPLIADAYRTIFPDIEFRVILNVFPEAAQTEQRQDKKLKLFWFSQTIGVNRGIDEVLTAMEKIGNSSIQLHLLGYQRESSIAHYRNMAKEFGLNEDQLHFYSPISADEIIYFASRFDIGLATETGVPFNREICLTNKLFTYIQAGLAVIGSDTMAQKSFFDQYPVLGQIYRRADATDLERCIRYYLQNPDDLQATKQKVRQLAITRLNWENESEKVREIVDDILKNQGENT